MKKYIAILVVLVCCAALAQVSSHKIIFPQPKSTLTVKSGGSIVVQSGGAISTAAQSTGNVTTSATGTAMVASGRGSFRVSVAGTIVPSLTLANASAAVLKDNSYFRCRRIGDANVVSVGQWD